VTALREAQTKAATAETFLSSGEQSLIYKTQQAAYRVSAGAFFQTNRHLTDELVKIVTQGQSGILALDLYAGVGLFSNILAENFQQVVAVESSKHSAADLKHNLSAINDCSKGEKQGAVGEADTQFAALQSTAEHYLAQAGVPQPDLAVMDPPRAGLGDRVTRALANWPRPASFMSPVIPPPWPAT